jgi:hypothetical protein
MLLFTGQLGTPRAALANVVPGWGSLVQIKAKKCFFPSSSWVYAFILTCDDKLAVWFKRGVHHRHHVATGGVPGVCCLYPGSNAALYYLAVAWWSAGHFVHRFLYRIMAYQIVAPPKAPCGDDCPPGVVVSCCGNALPPALHVTFTGAVTGSAVLTYNGTAWACTAALCGGLTDLLLQCTGNAVTDWGLNGSPNFSGGPNPCLFAESPATAGSTCSPLSLIFNCTGSAGCCNGLTFTATVTT